jgi:3D (Asp-Asp-Asp) domain-containing protein
MRPTALILVFVLSVCDGATLWAKTHGRRVLHMQATAFSTWKHPTASGTAPHAGVAAADPSVLPLGTVIRVTGAGPHSGEYIVTDTGAKIGGRRIDLFVPSTAEARKFGRKMVRVQVLHRGTGKQDAREKDTRRVDPRSHS